MQSSSSSLANDVDAISQDLADIRDVQIPTIQDQAVSHSLCDCIYVMFVCVSDKGEGWVIISLVCA